MSETNADDVNVKSSAKEIELGAVATKESDISKESISPVEKANIAVDPFKRPDSIYIMWLLSFIRRMWGVFPLLVSLLNTINKTYDIGAKLSAKIPGGTFFQYEPYLSVFSCDSVSSCGSSANAVSSGTFYCDELQDVESVTIQCPFTYREDFQGIVAIWSIIFGGYIVYYLAMTSWYSTWDLRYYIAEHHFKVHIISTVWKVIAISFTLVCTIYAFWSVKSQDQSYGFAYNDAMLYMSTVLFAVFNTVGILSFFKLHPSFTGYKDHNMKSFPDFIALKHMKEPKLINLYGGLIVGGDVLTILELAVAKSSVEHAVGVEKYCVSVDDATKAVTALKTMEIL